MALTLPVPVAVGAPVAVPLIFWANARKAAKLFGEFSTAFIANTMPV
jgi:hypothetical protein